MNADTILAEIRGIYPGDRATIGGRTVLHLRWGGEWKVRIGRSWSDALSAGAATALIVSMAP